MEATNIATYPIRTNPTPEHLAVREWLAARIT